MTEEYFTSTEENFRIDKVNINEHTWSSNLLGIF